MGVTLKLVADKLEKNRFGLAPKHPIVEGIKVVGLRPGKVLGGEEFDWYEDAYDWRDKPHLPPKWASPTDAAGRAFYAEADKAREEMALVAAKGKAQRGKPKMGTSGDAKTPPGAGPAAKRPGEQQPAGSGPQPIR